MEQKNKQLTILNSVEELHRVVEFLDLLEKEWNLAEGLKSLINLALEEALSNIIFYAFEKDSKNKITIEFVLKKKKLTIIIKDKGKYYDPTKKRDPDVSLSAEERPVGGLGIFLIKQIMDEINYRRDGVTNQLLMVKKL
ncbi:ATP-binding protein [Maribellus maritimus]|uniref:ATP-binding protein n=1 Tax=Maribellus maritimus TaxID=2870838 RepID=UPI001EEB9D8E|nr:ATP-binding protein [Maribellus maritimus]MCG6189048.1 ATP-binding protein [Maribellus maritimus]